MMTLFAQFECAPLSSIIGRGVFLTPSVEIIKPFLSSPLEDACVGMRSGSTTTPTRASEARFILRSWDPVERLVRDAVPSEKEAQLGRMFLHVAHGVQLEL